MEDYQKVPAIGPTNAKIVIIGEAPGEQEEKYHTPFVGIAGRILDAILEEAGIKREECYITNLYKYRPEKNDFSSVASEDLAKGKAELEEELMLVRPNVIVCLGEHALNAITSKKGIMRYRGSILATTFGKVIPIIHPAAIGREWKFRPLAVLDFIKVKKESESAGISRIPRNLDIARDFDRLMLYFKDIKDTKTKIAFDIETETEQISCISFSSTPSFSVCIPFWFGASGSMWPEEQELAIWQKIKEILEDPSIPKIAQNAQYDMTILRDKYGIKVQNLYLDTMVAFHSVYPELPKNLGLLCSIYTDVPYYKDWRITEDMTKFFEYNALDACVTFECAEKIEKEMIEFGVRDFYYEHMHSLIYPLMDITGKGVRLDSKLKKEVTKTLEAEVIDLENKLEQLVGHPLNINSHPQMTKWLYKELRLPIKAKYRKGRNSSTESADAEILEYYYKQTNLEALKVVLDIRERRKILSTYLETKYDKDKDTQEERARTSYLITGTETGRLSSRETVYGTGTNLQNIPKGIVRRMFIPDNGKTFINADLSQAEARVVAYLAGEDRLIKVFESGGDIHRKNAANIFGKREDQISQEEREIAKRVVHASNYGMGPITFSKQAGISVSEAKRLLNIYFAEYPRIKLWHMNTESQLKRTRTLVTPFGRKRTFFNRWDESLKKEAYAYIPQSTVADLLNMGLRRLYDGVKKGLYEIDILLQIHDAILSQVERGGVVGLASIIRSALTIPIRINNRNVIIPVDISTGDSWEDLKKLPLS